MQLWRDFSKRDTFISNDRQYTRNQLLNLAAELCLIYHVSSAIAENFTYIQYIMSFKIFSFNLLSSITFKVVVKSVTNTGIQSVATLYYRSYLMAKRSRETAGNGKKYTCIFDVAHAFLGLERARSDVPRKVTVVSKKREGSSHSVTIIKRNQLWGHL